jgi:DNA polymerase-3 subunit gamma/tau
VKAQDDARQAELKTGVRADPLVQAVLARFPGAEIVDVRKGEAVASQWLPPGDGDQGGAEPPPDDDGLAYGGDERPDDDEL